MRMALPVLCLVAFQASGLFAQEKPPPQEATDFIRFVEEDEADSLQTAVAAYERADGVRVELAGAVHIADKAYFDALNERFKKNDAVLYEMVGGPVSERKQRQEKDQDGEAGRLQWVGQLQEMMRKTLELESQLACINYEAPNFVHADMTTERFFQSQGEKQENFLSLWIKAVQAQNAAGGARSQPGLVELLRVLMSGDSATEMKRLIGREFDSVERILAGVEAEGGTTLIGERNRHALEVMDREIQAGKKRLAIFYGAAHLPDMEARLLGRGFKLVKVEHLKAWVLKDAAR